MKVFILSLIVLSFSVTAADKKVAQATKSKTTTPSGVIDIEAKGEKEEVAEQTATLTDKHTMKAHVTCKTKDGHELKQGDTGYNACIQKVKADKNSKNEPKADVEVKFEK